MKNSDFVFFYWGVCHCHSCPEKDTTYAQARNMKTGKTVRFWKVHNQEMKYVRCADARSLETERREGLSPPPSPSVVYPPAPVTPPPHNPPLDLRDVPAVLAEVLSFRLC